MRDTQFGHVDGTVAADPVGARAPARADRAERQYAEPLDLFASFAPHGAAAARHDYALLEI